MINITFVANSLDKFVRPGNLISIEGRFFWYNQAIMLLIKVTVKESSIHGLGLFAAEAIPKGARIWEYSPRLDKIHSSL